MKLTIYTDGASRGNPGHASYGFIVLDENGKLFYSEGKHIGITTNNVAEYTAVLEALKFVSKKFGGKKEVYIELLSDSKLVAEQLSGRFKVKSVHLRPIIEKIKILAMELSGAVYAHVPRGKNIEADKLANQALDFL